MSDPLARPVIAQRLWIIRSVDSLVRLKSVSASRVWHPKLPLHAYCSLRKSCPCMDDVRTSGIFHKEFSGVNPRCGIYGYNSEDALFYNEKDRFRNGTMGTGTVLVRGTMAIWGNIIVHEFGYIAQYAYPVSFLSVYEDIPKQAGYVHQHGLNEENGVEVDIISDTHDRRYDDSHTVLEVPHEKHSLLTVLRRLYLDPA